MADAIVKEQRALYQPKADPDGFQKSPRPGELLTMANGVQWFHPYGGGAPVQITDENRAGLTIDHDGAGVGWIVALKAAGYTVNLSRPSGFYQWNHDKSGAGSSGYSTEGDAWAAANHHQHRSR